LCRDLPRLQVAGFRAVRNLRQRRDKQRVLFPLVSTPSCVYGPVSPRKRSLTTAARIQTTIGGIERGERNIGLRNLFRLSLAPGVKPSRLLQQTEARIGKSS
jgi:hypothetical protein